MVCYQIDGKYNLQTVIENILQVSYDKRKHVNYAWFGLFCFAIYIFVVEMHLFSYKQT